MREAGLLDYVRIINEKHEHFGRTGRLTDYDTFDKEYILYFDKLTSSFNVKWGSECTRVKQDDVKLASKFDLERIN